MFSQKQIDNWKAYEQIRLSGLFNMFDPRAQRVSEMSKDEWLFCISNYASLRQVATQGEPHEV